MDDAQQHSGGNDAKSVVVVPAALLLSQENIESPSWRRKIHRSLTAEADEIHRSLASPALPLWLAASAVAWFPQGRASVEHQKFLFCRSDRAIPSC